MKIAVIGTGYVGLVAGACLAGLGNDVICADIDKEKIALLKKGRIPIYEPGLQDLVAKGISEKRLLFTAKTEEACRGSEIIFIAVGTPQGENGGADLKYVLQVAQTIGRSANGPKIIVDKSTVPVGTSEKVRRAAEEFSAHKMSVVSNPEFLREGCAVHDFMEPDRVVVGSDDKAAAEAVAFLYRPLGCEILLTSPQSAELIKYASNAFLATKISFINEIAAICENAGADILEVSRGMGLDRRIGAHFLNAGAGYGGSCFPKDVTALQKAAKDSGYRFGILSEVERINAAQKLLPVKKLKKALGALKGRKILVLGLAFKPNTDDMREATSIEVIKGLLEENAQVVAQDPAAAANAEKIFPKIEFAQDVYQASEGCDAIVLVTEWPEFLELDYARIGKLMKSKVIVDGRNALDKERLIGLGFKYVGVGR